MLLLLLQIMNESEWRATAWISLYLELVLCAHDKFITNVSFAYESVTYHDWHCC